MADFKGLEGGVQGGCAADKFLADHKQRTENSVKQVKGTWQRQPRMSSRTEEMRLRWDKENRSKVSPLGPLRPKETRDKWK